MKKVILVEDQNNPIRVLVRPLAGGEALWVLAPKRAVPGLKVAVVEIESDGRSSWLAACDPQKHPETGCPLAFYGRIIQIGGEVIC